MSTETEDNSKKAVDEFDEEKFEQNAIVIHLRILYRINVQEGQMAIKARMCPYGIRDKYRNTVGKYYQTARLNIIHLLLSMAALLFFQLEFSDINGAYLQSETIKRKSICQDSDRYWYEQKESVPIASTM